MWPLSAVSITATWASGSGLTAVLALAVLGSLAVVLLVVFELLSLQAARKSNKSVNGIKSVRDFFTGGCLPVFFLFSPPLHLLWDPHSRAPPPGTNPFPPSRQAGKKRFVASIKLQHSRPPQHPP